MILPVAVRPAAAAEMEEAYRWYEHERAGLGEEFLEAVRRLMAVIAEHPERFPVIHRQTRRPLIRRFPYGVSYRVKPGKIVIVACFHSKRNPRIWQSRH